MNHAQELFCASTDVLFYGTLVVWLLNCRLQLPYLKLCPCYQVFKTDSEKKEVVRPTYCTHSDNLINVESFCTLVFCLARSYLCKRLTQTTFALLKNKKFQPIIW